MFLTLYNVGAERMSCGRLFQATEQTVQNAKIYSRIPDVTVAGSMTES